MFKPILYRLKVKPDEVEERTKSGLYIVNADQEQKAGMTGTVVYAGDLAFEGREEIKKGDRILYVRYAGTLFTEDGTEYRYINDSDVIAVDR